MTPRQRDLYDYVKQYSGAHGYPPSIRNMATALKLNVGGIHRLLTGLKAEGHIAWTPRRRQSIRITKPNAVQLRPEVLELTDNYARVHGISRETATNELLRAALGAA